MIITNACQLSINLYIKTFNDTTNLAGVQSKICVGSTFLDEKEIGAIITGKILAPHQNLPHVVANSFL